MWRCERCGMMQSSSAKCGGCQQNAMEHISSGPQNQGHLNFLLNELSNWERWHWIDPETARRFRDYYRPLWEDANALAPMPSYVPRPRVVLAVVEPDTQAPPSPPRQQQVAAFLEERNISYWHAVGGALLLAGLAGLVRYTWSGAGRYLVFALLLALTVGVFTLAASRGLKEFRIGRVVLTLVGALLAPLDLIAANAFGLIGTHLTGIQIGLLTSAAMLPLYGALTRRDAGRTLAAFFALDCGVTLFFALQWLPGALHIRSLSHLYGAAYALLSLVFFHLASRCATGSRRYVWSVAAHISTLFGLIALVGSGDARLVDYAVNLGACGLVYFAAAIALNDGVLIAPAALAFLLAAECMVLRANALSTHWFAYLADAQGLAGILVAASASLRRRSAAVADWCILCARIAMSLGLTALLEPSITGLVIPFPNISLPLWDALEAAAVTGAAAIVYHRLGKPRASGTWIALASVFFVAACARAMPHGTRSAIDIAVLLAVAAVVSRFVTRCRMNTAIFSAIATVAAALDLVIPLHGVQGDLSLIAVGGMVSLEILAPAAWRDTGDEEQSGLAQIGGVVAMTWWLIAICLVLILHRQGVVIHALNEAIGIEENGGYFPALFGASLLLASLKPGNGWATEIETTLWTAGLSICLTVAVWEIGLAPHHAFPYSPVILLGALSILIGMVGAAKRSETLAAYSLGLLGCALLASAMHGWRSAYGLDVLTAGVTFACAAVSGYTSYRTQSQTLTFAALTALLIGYGECVCIVAHPAPLTLAGSFLIPAFAGLWVGIPGSSREGSRWIDAAVTCGELILGGNAILALMTISGTFWNNQMPVAVALLLITGAITAVLAVIRKDALLLGSAVFLANAAILGELYRLQPGYSADLKALLFGATGPFWIILGVTATKAIGKDGGRTLVQAGAAVSALSCILAVPNLHGNPSIDIIAVFPLGGAVFATVRILEDEIAWQHAAFLACFAAYAMLLYRELGPLTVALGDAYFSPAGIYLIVLAVCGRNREAVLRKADAVEQRQVEDAQHAYQAQFLVGMAFVMTPSLVAARLVPDDSAHVMILATECIAAVWYGLATRIRLVAGVGSAVLALLIGVQMQGVVTKIHWAVYATLLGMAIIGSALLLERKRAELIRLKQIVETYFDGWD